MHFAQQWPFDDAYERPLVRDRLQPKSLTPTMCEREPSSVLTACALNTKSVSMWSTLAPLGFNTTEAEQAAQSNQARTWRFIETLGMSMRQVGHECRSGSLSAAAPSTRRGVEERKEGNLHEKAFCLCTRFAPAKHRNANVSPTK